MYSIGFPKMLLNSTQTNLVEDHNATLQNLILTLKSDRNGLFGDPYFGSILKKMLFEQSDMLLKDLVIDEIYTCILTFMPQLQLNRNDITLTVNQSKIYVSIKCVNILNSTVDLYTIKLTEDSEI